MKMPKLGSELGAVQNPILQYAAEIGWEYVGPEEAERLRGGKAGFLFKQVFMNQMLKLNASFIDNLMIEGLIKKIEKLPTNIEGNLQAWEYLIGNKTIFVLKEKREKNVTLIDKNAKRNVFHVTDEFEYTNGTFTDRFDVVFLINGIPIFFVEAKASHKIGGLEIALDQVRRYHREIPEPLTILQVYTLTHLIRFIYASTWSFSMKSLFDWKIESRSRNFEELIKSFFDKETALKTVLDYVLFTRKDDELQKVVLRPHQIRAIEKVIERVASKTKNRGLIWHTQGSGKTYTMIVSAQKIIENPLFQNPTVIMLVDRNELESQLFGNLESVGVENVHVAETKEHLRELLRNNTRGLIVSTIHKFEGMPAEVNKRKNIFVLVDEAHRTTGGDLGNYLMGALPNAAYIGFTGTPIDRSAYGNGTFVTFGKDDAPHGYLDKYGIAESIEDGTTVKLHYTLASNELLPDKKILEKEFLSLKEAEGVSDIEHLNRILEKAVNLRNMLKNKERIKKVSKYIVEHYKNYVEPMGYKAFVVGVDRESCALYKQELDKYLPKEYSQVVYSPYNDQPELTKYYLSEKDEKLVRKAFVKPDKMPKMLIVTEKLLTGFDAPILYCMYLDKPMRDHVLLQAIARVNRPYEDDKGRKKPCGFVLDFVGIFDKLEKALSFDSHDIAGIIKDIGVLKDRFKVLIEKGQRQYIILIKNKKGDKAVEDVLEHFRNEVRRTDFYEYYNDLSNIYEILSPDSFLRAYLTDYDTLSRMFKIVKEAYDPRLLVDRDFARKTAKLVQEHTKSGKIKSSLEIYEIDENTIKKLEKSHASDTEKIFNLLKSIEHNILQHFKGNPYLISIGERAETISMMFKQRQKDTKETLEDLKDIINGINLAKKERVEKKMSSDIFSVYWILKEEKIENSEDISNNMKEVFDKYPYWKSNEEQERKIKQELYKLFSKGKINLKRSVEIVTKLTKILKETEK